MITYDNPVTGTRSRTTRIFALPRFGVLFIGLCAAQTLGGSLGSVLESIAKEAPQGGEQVARDTTLLLGRFARQDSRVLEDFVERLPKVKAPAASAEDLATELRTLGMRELSPALRRDLERLSDTERTATRQLLVDGGRIFAQLKQLGVPSGHLMEAIDRIGPRAFLTVRAMESPEGMKACVDGLRRWGTKFADFAQRGDEGAVCTLLRHADEIGPSELDEVLANPTKYFKPDGTPKAEFEGLPKRLPEPPKSKPLTVVSKLKWTAGGVGVTLIATGTAIVFLPDHVIDWIEDHVNKPAAEALRAIRWPLRLLFWGAVIYLAWPLLRRILNLLRWLARRLVAPVLPAKWRDRFQQPTRPLYHRLAVLPRRPALRLGLLGARRSGKSTFIVMLSEKLQHLAPGASLGPPDEHNAQVLKQIKDEVSHCRPTRDDKQVALDLTWPFDRAGQPLDGGKLDQQLLMTDFPGEWADQEAPAADRSRLTRHLRDVDGLFVVIDPTDLEGDDRESRVRAQEAALTAMFREDGLDLGRAFRRAITILITKRDAVSPELVRALAGRPGQPAAGCERAMELAAKPTLSDEESQEFGRWLLDTLCPDLRIAWSKRLADAVPQAARRRWWHGLTRYLVRPTSPQMAVYCVSLLGRELGQQSTAFRRAQQQWERDGRRGAEPVVQLDIAGAPPGTMEFHHPFRWMFDHVPDGLLHEAKSRSGLSALWYRHTTVYRRFRGAPAVRQARRVGWTRLATAVAGLVFAGMLVKPLLRSYEIRQERGMVEELFNRAAAGQQTSEILLDEQSECLRLPTHPYVTELNALGDLLHGEIRFRQFAFGPDQPPQERVSQSLDWLGVLRNLPVPSHSSLLRPVWQRLSAPYNDRLTDLSNDIQKSMDAANCSTGYDNALKLTKRAREEVAEPVEDKHPPELLLTRLDQLSQDAADRQATCDWSRVADEIDKKRRHDPPQFDEVVRAIDGFLGRTDLPSALLAEVRSRRSNVLEEFWAWTKDQVEDAVRNIDFDKADGLMTDFARVPEPNPHRPELDKLRAGLPTRCVEAAVNRSKERAGENQLETAWVELQKGHAYLGKAERDAQQSWYDQALTIKGAQDLWEDALLLLRTCGQPEEWVRPRLSEVWQSGSESVLKKAERELASGHCDDAQKRLASFLNLGSDCPPEIHQRIQACLDQNIPPCRIAEAIARADELMKQGRAQAGRDALLAVKSDTAKIANSELLGRWRDKVVEAYKQLHAYRDAVALVRDTQHDPHFPPQPDLLAQIASDWADHVRQEFVGSTGRGEWPNAWNLLLDAEREVDPPPPYADQIREFRAAEVEKAFERLRKRFDEECNRHDYARARIAIDDVEKQIGAGASAWGLEEQFKNLHDEIETRHVEWASGDPGASPEEAYNRNEEMLRRPNLRDDLRKRLSAAQRRNLVRWERLDYHEIYNAVDQRAFEGLSERIRKYTTQTAYREQRAPERMNAVVQIQTWVDAFDQARQFQLLSFELQGLPSEPWYTTNWSPAAVLVIRNAAGQQLAEIRTKCASRVHGNVTLGEFVGPQSFHWKKGDALWVGIYHLEVGPEKLAEISVSDAYALPALALEGATKLLEPVESSLKGKDMNVRLNVGNLEPLPQLPEYK